MTKTDSKYFIKILASSLALGAVFYSSLTIAHASHQPIIQRDDLLVRPIGEHCFMAPACSELPKADTPAQFLLSQIVVPVASLQEPARVFQKDQVKNQVNNKSPPIGIM